MNRVACSYVSVRVYSVHLFRKKIHGRKSATRILPRASTRASGRNYFAEKSSDSGISKSWNGPCQACRYVIRAVRVSLSKRDRTSFPSRSGTIYESVNLSPGGFSWRTGNEPCDRMWEERERERGGKKRKYRGKPPVSFPNETQRSKLGRVYEPTVINSCVLEAILSLHLYLHYP